jgi:hypothetical protein
VVFFQVVASLIAGVWRSRPPGLEWPVISLFVSHGVSFVQNHLVRRECASLDEGQLMIQPYGRIVLMHVTILAGGLPVMLLGSPVPLLVILIGLKIAVDIALHNRSHARIGWATVQLRAGKGRAKRRPPRGRRSRTAPSRSPGPGSSRQAKSSGDANGRKARC